MKKISLILLGLLLVFAVSCSTEDNFLGKVKGKTATFEHDTYTTGSFGGDGRSFSFDASKSYTFTSATSDTIGVYGDVTITVVGDTIGVVGDGLNLSGTLD